MQEDKILDVVEEFHAANQSDAYRVSYKIWRRKPENQFAFRFSKNPKEASFSENQAVVSETPAQAEQTVLRRFGVLFGYALLVYLVIENVFDKLAIVAARRFGIHIELMYWGENRYFGDDFVVFLFSAGVQIMKLLVPMLLIVLTLRMPLRVAVPMKVRNRKQFLYSLPLMMLLSVALGISMISRSTELEKYRLITDAVVSKDHLVILYILFTIFIAPIFWEFMFHSAMFQALRQFGDSFAVTTVTVLAAFLTHNFHDAVRIGLVTLLISYFMLRTGSFLTAVILRIIHEIYMFSLFQIENYGGIYSMQWWITVLFPCLVGLLTLLVIALNGKGSDTGATRTPTYLGRWDQISALFTTMPMVGALIACVILLVVSLMLG